MILSHVWVWLYMGFGLVIGFIKLLQNVTTNNYDSLTELRTPKIAVTTAHTESSQFAMSSPVVGRWRIPTMSSASVITFLPAGDRLTTHPLLQMSTPKSKSKSELLYDWRFTANQFVLVSSFLRLTTRDFLQLNPCGHSPYVTFSLMRWVCELTVLLITSRHGPHRKQFLLLFPIFVVQTCLFTKLLLSNGCCTNASSAVVA
jgi:hypothetical protein